MFFSRGVLISSVLVDLIRYSEGAGIMEAVGAGSIMVIAIRGMRRPFIIMCHGIIPTLFTAIITAAEIYPSMCAFDCCLPDRRVF